VARASVDSARAASGEPAPGPRWRSASATASRHTRLAFDTRLPVAAPRPRRATPPHERGASIVSSSRSRLRSRPGPRRPLGGPAPRPPRSRLLESRSPGVDRPPPADPPRGRSPPPVLLGLGRPLPRDAPPDDADEPRHSRSSDRGPPSGRRSRPAPGARLRPSPEPVERADEPPLPAAPARAGPGARRRSSPALAPSRGLPGRLSLPRRPSRAVADPRRLSPPPVPRDAPGPRRAPGAPSPRSPD